MNQRIIINLVLICLIWTGYCSIASGEEPVENKSITAAFLTEPPSLDGKLDDPCWLKQTPVTDLITMYPVQGEKPAASSRIWVAYDHQNLYLACETILPESLKVTARTLKRDDAEVNYDDCIFIYLDCLNDQRSCYFFGVNALGTQYDGHAEGEGSKTDLRWDGIWQSATSYSLHSWTCEIAIPFRILRYDPKAPRWGINFLVDLQGRQIGYWANTGMNPAGVSKFGSLVGLEQIQAKTHFNLFPYLSFNHDRYGERENNFKFPYKYTDEKGNKVELGLDVKGDLTNALTLNLTLNPDFAIIEADVDQFNLFPKERFIPEKRPFFLEGLEFFKTPLNLLYTRAIGSLRDRENPVDILGGAKLVGRIGSFSLGGLNVIADRAKGVDRQNFSAFRLQKDIFKSSNVGILATATHQLQGDMGDARWLDGALAFDSYLALGKDFGFYPFVSVIHHPGLSIASKGKDDWAYSLAWQRLGSAPLQFKLAYQDIPENFQTSTSYVPYLDIKGYSLNVSYSWWLRKYGFYNLNPYGTYERYYTHEPDLSQFKTKTQDNFSLGFGTTLMNMTDIYLTRYEYRFTFPQNRYPYYAPYDIKFNYDFWEFYLGTHTWKSIVGNVTYRVGNQYYLFGSTSTKFIYLQYFEEGQLRGSYSSLRQKNWDNSYRHLILSSQIKPLDRLQLTFNLENVHFDFLNLALSDTSSSQWIFSIRSHLLIATPLSFKAFYQENQEDNTRDLNLLIEYNYLPGSYVYLAYNHNEDLKGNALAKHMEDLFFIKMDYWFNF